MEQAVDSTKAQKQITDQNYDGIRKERKHDNEYS